jgi:hypothetical protein
MDFNNQNINAALIKLETLEKEYEVVLQQYQEAFNNYINTLQTNESNPCFNFNSTSKGVTQACYDKIWQDQGCISKPPDATSDSVRNQTLDELVQNSYFLATNTDDRKTCYSDSTNYTTAQAPVQPNTSTAVFASLPSRSWWGTSSLKEGTVSTEEDCKSMCAMDDKCSGATFNPVKKYCWTRSGDGNLTTSTDTDVALIPNQKATLLVLKGLNDKLIQLNQDINSQMQQIEPQVDQQQSANQEKQQQLNEYYNKLLEQKQDMEKQLQEYYSVEQNNEEQTIFVTQEDVSYRFWTVLTAIIILITLKKMYGGSNVSIAVVFWLMIIILLIFLSFSLQTPSGFMVWFIFIICIGLMKTGNLPSP